MNNLDTAFKMFSMFSKSPKKQSEDGKKRQERQMYLAKEDPHPSLDLSACELTQFPDAIFSLVKCLRKEIFLVGTNAISSFDSGGKLSDLYLLQTLDLSENQLDKLPSNFGASLINLRTLNLRDNKLSSLPDSIAQLKHLTQINLKRNKFEEFPLPLCDVEKLQGVDLQQNEKMSRLPPQLSRRSASLKAFFVDAKNFDSPDSLVVANGLKATMKAICASAGVAYQPPVDDDDEVVDGVVDDDPDAKERKLTALKENQIAESKMEENRRFFEDKEERKRLDALRTEVELRKTQDQEFQLVARLNADKNLLNEDIQREEEKIAATLADLLDRRDAERLHLLDSVKDAEKQVGDLIDGILRANERAKLIEAIMDIAERDRAILEDYYLVKVEEVSFVRKQDVEESMRQLELLQNDERMLEAFRRYDEERGEAARRALHEIVEDEKQFDKAVDETLDERQRVVAVCLEEVEFQKMAYESLVMAKDSQHERLRKEIAVVEAELMCLTTLEVEKKAAKVESEKAALAEQRANLAAMLLQLLDEKVKREEELKKRLVEMEEKREEDIKQYWLIQYQRLMDRKPESLMDDEYRQLEAIVAALLKEAGADDLVQIFAKNRITIETMMTLGDEELEGLGVEDQGKRKAVLKQIQVYREEQERAAEKTRRLEGNRSTDHLSVGETGLTVKIPSAPPSPPEKKKSWSPPPPPTTKDTCEDDASASSLTTASSLAVVSPTASITGAATSAASATIVKLHEQTECVICMEVVPNVIFLPCGHVCGCSACAEPLKECPLCRQEIRTKLIVGGGSRIAV